ncbi:MAG TPA: ubiquinone/menaquinone biosynthesis methyltransferase [Syntrophales bacterium]|nr:ubiquinone/menaquinone biosynthesis methyltransferase [Syntrophales bacterium]
MVDRKTARKPLHGIFTSVTPQYDLINHVMTLGLDFGWRKKAVEACLEGAPGTVLDLCCGTGDLGLGMARAADFPTRIVGLDYSPPMLEAARAKAERKPRPAGPVFVLGDVSALPFASGRFDCIGISFAFRNLTYKNPLTEKFLAEILRVLKRGGRFVIVETSQPPNPLIRVFHRAFLRGFVFPVGALLSDCPQAYRYLADSAARYYGAEEMVRFLQAAGFRRADAKRMFFGAAALYVAWK